MSETTTLLVVGDGPVADAVVPMAGLLGWECHRASDLPETLAALPSAQAVVVTSHHAEVDGPAIKAALAAGTPYLGAMGSRRTQARRREWLLANGVSEESLERLHGPAGLAIGADPPPEIALSILAEAVAVLRGAAATGVSGSLRDSSGPIHPDLPPGEATCPTG